MSATEHEAGRLLVVDDDPYLLLALRQTLELAGFAADTFGDPLQALASARETPYAAVLADIRMPEMDGMTLLARLLELDPDLPVMLITGHGDVALAVQAMKAGAYDFLQKPVDDEVLLGALRRALERRRLVRENRRLEASLAAGRPERAAFYGLVGAHPAMRRVYELIESMGPASDPVLISGGTGSGKELAARALHALSAPGQPFVAVNMAALPADMLESELFGHERGAFTGADSRRAGKFEFAGNGTLFLDEICSMPLALQAKLLRVLEDRAFSRLGGNTVIPLEARVISATNRDLEVEIRAGRFREDLYFRLNVLPLPLPALAERREDIPLLAQHFVEEYNLVHDGEPVTLAPAFVEELCRRPWPGNVRELRNVIRRHCILHCRGTEELVAAAGHCGGTEEVVVAAGAPEGRVCGHEAEVLARPERAAAAAARPDETAVLPENPPTLKAHLEDAERRYIEAVLRRCKGRVSEAARMLGLSRKSVYEKVRQYGIELDRLRQGGAETAGVSVKTVYAES